VCVRGKAYLIIALLVRLRDDARLLEKVVLDVSPNDLGVLVEVELHELAEARRVVVARRL
jgi:hypothetical protein